jgi:dolichyl-diphosphooligosaccharide---protein glycosyltransferase
LAPFFSGLSAVAAYLLTSELWNARAGLFAAAFLGLAPGYASRSVAGSYDNEGIAIFALIFTFYLWIKALKTGNAAWAAATALSYAYMVAAWGGYVYIINLIPLHALALLAMRRFSARLYVAYSVFYVLGTLLSMQVPFVGFQPVRTSEHMAAMGMFLLMQVAMGIEYLRSLVAKERLEILLRTALIAAAGAVFLGVVLATSMGYVAPWTGRFYSLWDTGYAKIHIPIIASVSEHQPTTWTSFVFDLFVRCGELGVCMHMGAH